MRVAYRLVGLLALLVGQACTDDVCQLGADCDGLPTARIAVSDADVVKRETVTLDGRGSLGRTGAPLSFQWSLVAPATSSTALSSKTESVVTLTPDMSGVYGVVLVVAEGERMSEPKEVFLDVSNTPPMAVAGDDLSLRFGEAAAVDGSSSTDANGDPLTYRWAISTEPVGSTAMIVDAGERRASFIPGVRGRYALKLTVSDGEASSSDTLLVSVGITANAPVADPGSTLRILLGETAMLDGSASRDADGDVLEFSWRLVGVPLGSTATIADRTAVRTGLTPDLAGTYTVELVVSDGFNVSVPAQVLVVVLPQPDPSGCVGGVRTGFTEVALFPDIAGCGPLSDYPTAMERRGSVCAGGFHPCSVDDPRVLALRGAPAPSDTRVWLPYELSQCQAGDQVYDVPDCAGTTVQTAALVGTGGCMSSGACGQGYRPLLWTLSWDWSGRLPGGGACIAHLNHACGYPGGEIASVDASVACCRDP